MVAAVTLVRIGVAHTEDNALSLNNMERLDCIRWSVPATIQPPHKSLHKSNG